MREKQSKIGEYIFILILSLCIGVLIGHLMKDGKDINRIIENLSEMEHFKLSMLSFNAYTLPCMGYSFLFAICFVALDYAKPNNYRRREEYGSVKWLSPTKATKKLTYKEDKIPTRILSQNVRFSLNTRFTGRNNNWLLIGGSGSSKTTKGVYPNLLQCSSSFVITDPKGEILRTVGKYLQQKGYEIKVLNLIDMSKSYCYNPFAYIRKQSDISKLITNIFNNTKDKEASKGEQFWDDAAKMYLEAIFTYIWTEKPKSQQNFNTFLDMLSLAKISEDENEKSELDLLFLALELSHPARKIYEKFMAGAGDTLRSVIITVNSKMQVFDNPELRRIFEEDEIDIPFLGMGRNGDRKTKTALFCVIPDSDKTYNFVVGMLYTQLFQELYYQADFIAGGTLPIDVALWMDEFANVALPDDFASIESTMRSRGIYVTIIIQNLAQLKVLFKESWETIPGNCDTLVYLGGNEQSTFEYISKLMGNETIDKDSTSRSVGKDKSNSRSHDVIQRSLLLPEEVRKIDRNKCIVFIRGLDPIIDNKYNTFITKEFKEAKKLGAYNYMERKKSLVALMNEASFSYYKARKEIGEHIEFINISAETILKYESDEIEDISELEQEENIELLEQETLTKELLELENDLNKKKAVSNRIKDVFQYISTIDLDSKQRNEILEAYKNGLEDWEIPELINYSATQMRIRRNIMQQLREKYFN